MSDDAATAAPRSSIDHLADAVSIASDFGIVWVAVSALKVLAGRSTTAGAIRRLAAAGFTSLALTRVLKHYFAVPRAELDASATRARTPTSSSFPSGHTLAAFASALVIPTSRRGRIAALSFAVLVAWSRVRVGHHQPADVAAGAVAGSVVGAGVAALL